MARLVATNEGIGLLGVRNMAAVWELDQLGGRDGRGDDPGCALQEGGAVEPGDGEDW